MDQESSVGLCYPSILIFGCDDTDLLVKGNYVSISFCSATIVNMIIGVYFFRKRKGKGNVFQVVIIASVIFLIQSLLALFQSVPSPILSFIAQSIPTSYLAFIYTMISKMASLLPDSLQVVISHRGQVFLDKVKSPIFYKTVHVLLGLGMLIPLFGFINADDQRFILLFGALIPAAFQFAFAIFAISVMAISRRLLSSLKESYKAAGSELQKSQASSNPGYSKTRAAVETNLNHLILASGIAVIATSCAEIGQIYCLIFYHQIISQPEYRIFLWILISVAIPSLLFVMSVAIMVNEIRFKNREENLSLAASFGSGNNSHHGT